MGYKSTVLSAGVLESVDEADSKCVASVLTGVCANPWYHWVFKIANYAFFGIDLQNDLRFPEGG
jgi:hypothetical protein